MIEKPEGLATDAQRMVGYALEAPSGYPRKGSFSLYGHQIQAIEALMKEFRLSKMTEWQIKACKRQSKCNAIKRASH